MDIVFAVNWPPQAPAPGQAPFSASYSSSSVIFPARYAPIASNTVTTSAGLPLYVPGRIVPLYRIRPGMPSRPSAIAAAGMVLSQPTRQTRPSNRCPRATSSMESAMTSRLISDAFMPSVPIDTPSLTEIVLNSIGVPPASRMPCFTDSASRRWFRLQGMVSIQVVATPTIGHARSSSVNPTALSIARAAARSGPSVSAWL